MKSSYFQDMAGLSFPTFGGQKNMQENIPALPTRWDCFTIQASLLLQQEPMNNRISSFSLQVRQKPSGWFSSLSHRPCKNEIYADFHFHAGEFHLGESIDSYPSWLATACILDHSLAQSNLTPQSRHTTWGEI